MSHANRKASALAWRSLDAWSASWAARSVPTRSRERAAPSGSACPSHSPIRPWWHEDEEGDMSSGRILIADDEPSVRDSVGYALAQEGFDVTPVADGDEAAERVGDGIPYDLLILDIMMRGPSGLDICRDVRSRSAVPIILLTAKDAEVDKVVGLEVGADDYATKPFSVRELLGRVRAQLRRRELDRAPLSQAVKVEAGPVAIDLVRHVATVRDEPVNLTRSEFQLLRLLVGRARSEERRVGKECRSR